MKKRLVTVIMVLVMVIAQGMIASAAEVRTSQIVPTLSFSGTTANCKVSITQAGKKLEATLELWNGSTLVDSWTASASTRLVINETCTVVRGQTYTLKVSGTIGGEAFEGTPVSAKCN